ncbi:MAG: hypothetical protein AB7G39_11350 [Alphaproteobacteria bacterium]
MRPTATAQSIKTGSARPLDTMSVLAFVDSPQAVERARNAVPAAALVTDNPMLVEWGAGRGIAIENAETEISQDEANAICLAAWEAVAAADAALCASQLGDRLNLDPEHLHTSNTGYVLLSAYLYPLAVLTRLIERQQAEAFHLFADPSRVWEPRTPMSISMIVSPLRTLAEAGAFPSTCPIRFHAVSAGADGTINDTRSGDLALRSVILPASTLLAETALRFGKAVGLGRRSIPFIGKNEAIRETLGHLLLAGEKIERLDATLLDRRSIPSSVPETLPAPEPSTLALVVPAMAAYLQKTGFLGGTQIETLTGIWCSHLDAELHAVSRLLPEKSGLLKKLFSPQARRHKLLMTNGLHGILGHQIFACLQRLGVEVVGVEHGVTVGLALCNDVRTRTLEAATTSRFLVCAETARQANLKAIPERHDDWCNVIGLAEQTRQLPRRPLQRFLARRALKIPRRDSVLMHVDAFLFGGPLRYLYTPTSPRLFDIQTRLTREVYRDLPHRVLYKEYPTKRFPYHPPIADWTDGTERPGNIGYLGDSDFRYMRAAADIIVTNVPTSTLGWCLGTGVPLVYMDSREIKPLIDEAMRRAFRDALFVVDIDDPNWPQHLRMLVDRPLDAIRTDWQRKKLARDALLRAAIFGPPGSVGHRAACLIREMLSQPRNGLAATL